jgi:curved DNA-binding protein CbpA
MVQTLTDVSDHYEALQLSTNADTETIQRVFRILAQRFHPDNHETGNAARFRMIHEAYLVLSDPERRAEYDARHETARQERWRFAARGGPNDNDFALEQHVRFLLLDSHRRTEPDRPGMSQLDLAQLLGRPREHLEFTIWYLTQRKLVTRCDQSNLTVTADGIDYVEQNRPANPRRLRLAEAG